LSASGCIRLKLTESPLFVKVRKQHAEDSRPVVDVAREYGREILLGSGAKIAESALFTIYAVVVVAYAVNRGIPKDLIANAILIAVGIELFTLPLFGAISDRIGRRPLYLGGALLQLAMAFPFFIRPKGACVAGLRARAVDWPRRNVRAAGRFLL
jgi:MHS family shikimate/dehydroshikimate transporter-like MFS transporter